MKITPAEVMRRRRVVKYRQQHKPTRLELIQIQNYLNGGTVPKAFEVLDKVVK